jgi:NodT family efflux transporter outer membrane factor (OMF) lipoprotein
MNKTLNYATIMLISVFMLTSCGIVTKTYKQPSQVVTDSLYRDAQTDTATVADLPWHELFSDPVLQKLIQEGLDQNLDLKSALEKMNEAKAYLTQEKLSLLPSVSGLANVTREKLSQEANPPSTTTLNLTVWEAGLSTSWELDVWGKLNSSRKAALANFLKSDAARRAAQTELIADIANTYYSLIAMDEKLAITKETVRNRADEVKTMKNLKESAVVNGAAVVQSQANLYSVQISIPDLQQSIRETENTLCILLGRAPGSIERGSLAQQSTLSDLKTGVSSQLLKNRPDVQEAELALRAAFENTNVARASFYPSLNISADGGLSAYTLSNFFDHSLFYTLIGGLTQPIFNNGRNQANLKIAKAQQQEAFYNFKKSTLTAGEEVSNALYAYQMAVEKETTRTKQLDALETSVDFTNELLRYSSATNYTDVLTSEQSLLSAQLSSINDKVQKLQAIVNLYKALGGGWK